MTDGDDVRFESFGDSFIGGSSRVVEDVFEDSEDLGVGFSVKVEGELL